MRTDHTARAIFMGTPDFAAPSLKALIDGAPPGRIWPAGLQVVGVVTRPDKPTGRGQRVAYSPVKQTALSAGLPVLQPGSLRRPDAQEELRALRPDIIIVAAFGQILPPLVLSLPPYGCLNVHASLLPRWRGASPISAAIRAGDTQTGITIMEMDEGLDTGAILTQRATPIDPSETTGLLTDRLAALGAELLTGTLPHWLECALTPTPQDTTLATMTRPLRKEEGKVDWSLPAEDIARHIRAMTPWPGAFTTWNGKTLKILDATLAHNESSGVPGTCFAPSAGGKEAALACVCGRGALALRVIQLEGKRALPSAEVLRGHPALASATLGT